MEDLYAVLSETWADAGNTPYPVALFRSVEHCIRETDDPPPPHTARQQLARALRGRWGFRWWSC